MFTKSTVNAAILVLIVGLLAANGMVSEQAKEQCMKANIQSNSTCESYTK